MWRMWDEMGHELGGERELRVEEDRSRTSLIVREFAAKFEVKITDDANALVSVPLIEPGAFQLIRPSDSLQTGRDKVFQAPPHSRSSIQPSNAIIVQRIEGILQRDGFTLSVLDGVLKLRPFQPSLRRLLRENPEFLHLSSPRRDSTIVA
ncbi:hypothetical protein E0Z10_g7631 [Xylaria hypoxylon]|uniref:Uncharacterized protein n=1 Tax=Xylaria hypoxylon TaxID=37992 RepID=A0A4Z0YNV6_9PEZI|nr:hypothetical protein E0Z10_g7631 [Xylaria hypoxylon]